MPRLAGRVAVITGASSGIGAASARAFARAGLAVVLGARRSDRLGAVVEGIRAEGGRARGVTTDVARREDVHRLVAEAVAAFGRLDVLLNNAGHGYFGPVESTPVEEARRLFDVNAMGTLYGVQAAVPIMRRQGRGHIISVASLVGKRATPGSGVYAATKSVQVALSEALRLEVASAGIRVSVICPVATTTEFFEAAHARSPLKVQPAGPTHSAERVAAAILRCVRRPRPEVMVFPLSRALLVLNAAAPRLVDRLLRAYWRRVRPEL
jgi:short-subunit dehydrogenase